MLVFSHIVIKELFSILNKKKGNECLGSFLLSCPQLMAA